MARKGRKTRWRKLPIPIGNNQGETSCAPHNVPNNLEPEHPHQPPSSPFPKEQVSRVTFNEDEYTKITTPRQDMLFKKGYLSKKRPQPQEQQTSYTSPEPSQSPSESVESEQYVGCDEAGPYPPPFVYPTGYMDPNGLFYLNGSGSYEVYDPYTNSVTVIVGPGAGYPGQPVLAAVPCHPLPLQPIEWFNPPPQHQPTNFKKRNSTDSQNWGSSQSCESPLSGQELETPDSSLFYPQPQYIYPGYMFGAPLYNINGVSVQGAAPPPPQHQAPQHVSSQNQPSLHQPQPADQPKRRKKRRKRRRPGMGDDGSESSCEEVAGSGVSSDAGQGSSCSKTTDSGIHTGADSPQPQSSPVPVHDSPLPDVSTEEEPSQPSISQVPCITLNTHLTTDSSTEDETNLQPHDISLVDGLEKSIENINIHESTNLLEALEIEMKEERVKQINADAKETVASTDELPPKDEIIFENGIEENNIMPKIKRDESDEWVNAKENGSENEEDSSCVIEESLKDDNCLSVEAESCSSPEKIRCCSPLLAPLLGSPQEELCFPLQEELCSSPDEEGSCLSPETAPSLTLEETFLLSLEKTPSISPKESATTVSLEDTPLFPTNGPDESQAFIEETLPDYKEDIEECIAEETGYSEEGWGSAEETSVEERWAMAELGEEVMVDKPITEAVTRWLESQGSKALVPHPPIESEDEGIGEETSSPTGSKNVKGNPCLVQYPSTGTRVANMSKCESEACAWKAKCDPVVSVDRYYRLGAELPPTAPAFKTATAHPTIMHIDPSIPFPCGLVCCILQ